MAKPKTKGQQALAAVLRSMREEVVQTMKPANKADLVDLMEAAPGEERAAKRREMVLNAMSPKRRNKHGNNVTYTEEGKWDSDAEKERWPLLKALQKAGKIFGLKRQVRIPLHVDKELIGHYVADFVYCPRDVAICFSPAWGFVRDAVVEDVKGMRTDMFKWKAKMVKAEYGIVITEVKA